MLSTHLHWDHAGGFTRRSEGGKVKVTFPGRSTSCSGRSGISPSTATPARRRPTWLMTSSPSPTRGLSSPSTRRGDLAGSSSGVNARPHPGNPGVATSASRRHGRRHDRGCSEPAAAARRPAELGRRPRSASGRWRSRSEAGSRRRPRGRWLLALGHDRGAASYLSDNGLVPETGSADSLRAPVAEELYRPGCRAGGPRLTRGPEWSPQFSPVSVAASTAGCVEVQAIGQGTAKFFLVSLAHAGSGGA